MPEHITDSQSAGAVRAAADMEALPARELMNADMYAGGLEKMPIQRKLSVGAADDPLEREADDMADKVMRMPEVSFAQRKCAHCEEEEIHRKPLVPFIMKKGMGGAHTASEDITSGIQSTKGGGAPIPGTTRSFMESRFGADFSAVRVHTGDYSAKLSKDLNAQAFTTGNDIYFNEGKFAPESREGQHLLAHELTHTIQQNGSAAINTKIQKKEPGETLEFNTDIKEINIGLITKVGEMKFGGNMAIVYPDDNIKNLLVLVHFKRPYPDTFTKYQAKPEYSISYEFFEPETAADIYDVYDQAGKEVTQFTLGAVSGQEARQTFSKAERESLTSSKKIPVTITINTTEEKKPPESKYKLKKGATDELDVEKPQWAIDLLALIKADQKQKKFDNNKTFIYASRGMEKSKAGTIWAFQARTSKGVKEVDDLYFSLPVTEDEYKSDSNAYSDKLIDQMNGLIDRAASKEKTDEVEKKIKEQEKDGDGKPIRGFPEWAVRLRKTVLAKFDDIEAKLQQPITDKPDTITLRYLDNDIHFVIWSEVDVITGEDKKQTEKKLATSIIPLVLEESLLNDPLRIELLVEVIRNMTADLRGTPKIVTEQIAPAYAGSIEPNNTGVTLPTNSILMYRMKIDKGQGFNLLDAVTKEAHEIHIRWEVVNIDDKKDTTELNRLAGVAANYRRRMRELKDDSQTIKGDKAEQSLFQQVARGIAADAITDIRVPLALLGETAMTLIKPFAYTAGGNNEDSIEVPFDKEGTYMVRAIARPYMANPSKLYFEPTIAGVIVNVQNISTIANEMMPSAEAEATQLKNELAATEEERKKLEQQDQAGNLSKAGKARLEELKIKYDYLQEKIAAGSDVLKQKQAEINNLERVKDYITKLSQSDSSTQNEAINEGQKQQIAGLNKQIERLKFQVDSAKPEEDTFYNFFELMPAVLVNETSGNRDTLLFKVAYRKTVINSLYEIYISDISNKDTRQFFGSGDTKEEAWQDALATLRANLNRGRGWLSFQAPPSYVKFKAGVPNPMQLQVSIKDQLAETVSDSVNVATLVAIMAAPFTAGASLTLLAPLGAIGAGVSAYRIINRAEYGDLRLDFESANDVINIATLGLSKYLQYAGKLRQVGLLVQGGKVAVKLLEFGGYAIIAKGFFEDMDGINPVEARRRKIFTLISLLQAVGVSHAGELHEYFATHESGLPGAASDKAVSEGKPADKAYTYEINAAEKESLAQPLKEKGLGETKIYRNRQLEGKTVRVIYVEGELRVEVGPEAGAEQIRQHVDTVTGLKKFEGFYGTLYKLRDMILNALKIIPGYNTKGYEAVLELNKLNPIQAQAFEKLRGLEIRLKEIQAATDKATEGINNSADDAARATQMAELEAQIKKVTAELGSIESQINQYNKDLGSFDKGKGFVAAEDRTAAAKDPAALSAGELQDAIHEQGDSDTRKKAANKERLLDVKTELDKLTADKSRVDITIKNMRDRQNKLLKYSADLKQKLATESTYKAYYDTLLSNKPEYRELARELRASGNYTEAQIQSEIFGREADQVEKVLIKGKDDEASALAKEMGTLQTEQKDLDAVFKIPEDAGGSYKRLSDKYSQKKVLEANHIPPQSAYAGVIDLTEGEGPAIMMLAEDHARIPSTNDPAYREEIKALIAEGKFAEAMEKDIATIEKLFPDGRYANALLRLRLYVKTISASRLVPHK